MTGESSVTAAIGQLTTSAMETFNKAHANYPNIAYYSIAGRSAYALAKTECALDLLVNFVVKYDKNIDALDVVFFAM